MLNLFLLSSNYEADAIREEDYRGINDCNRIIIKLRKTEMISVKEMGCMEALDTQTYEDDDTQDDLYLTFSIENEVFGIGIGYVREIIGIQPITVIPDFPEHIKGIINLRGKIIPVMDVRLRFKKPAQVYDSRTCIVVVNILDTSIGLIVDRVAEVVAIPESDIASPPQINKREGSYIKGFGKVGGGIKLLLDCGVLLNDEAEAIMQAEENRQ